MNDVQWGVQLLWLITSISMFLYSVFGDLDFLFNILEGKWTNHNADIKSSRHNLDDKIKDILHG